MTGSTASRAADARLLNPPAVELAAVDPGSEHWDVVVVGLGIAGGCAALEAARAGSRVLVLERAAVHGGTTSMAGGHFYLGGGTAVQAATGHHDTAEQMYRYLVATSTAPEDEKIRLYCDDSVEHFDWLESMGFQFERSYYPNKAVIQPQTQGLMYTGNEKVWPYRDLAEPAPRGHKVPVPGDTQGARLVMDLLRDRCEEAGVVVRYETGATNLILEGERVAGVRWRQFDTVGDVLSDAVVLAAGGFVMNSPMVAAYTPSLASLLIPLGSTYDDGVGIRLGASAGAELKHMDEPFITAPFYPPEGHVKGLIVNKLGQRFVAEDSYHARTGYFTMRQPDSAAYLIVDSEHVEEQSMPLTPLIDGFEKVAEIEKALDIPPGQLEQTLERYNTGAARGEDPDFFKHPDWLAPQDAAPWAVFDLSLGKALYSGFTLGGMRTSSEGEVLRADGSVVGGLYAAGACASNIAIDGAGYCSGTQLGEGSYFGRRAGRAAARTGRTNRVTTVPTIDFTDPIVNERGIPHDDFAAARAATPVLWIEQPEEARSGFPGKGYWAVTRHADVLAVSKNSSAFSSFENGSIIRLPAGVSREQVELQRLIPINQDDPDHARHRAVVSRGFTPRAVAQLHQDLETRARTIVGAARDAGSGNFVEQVAAELPLQAIAQLLGVPQEDRSQLFSWSNAMMSYDEAQSAQDAEAASTELFLYFMAMAEDRVAAPREDIITKLVQSGPHGEAMSPEQFGFFVTLLVVAGNETTRNAITLGMDALLENPDQWKLFKEHRPPTAADEIIRWASPVIAFQRTATRDITVGGQLIRSGERVGLFYSSANFDEAVFETPLQFDISRDPNPHLGFGGHGPHYCIGANLARLEVSIMLNTIADIVPDIAKTGAPRRQRHSWINGVSDLEVTYRR